METLREKYWKAGKKEKGRILDEYCGNTGQDRKYVIKKMNYGVRLKKEKKKRKRIYEEDVVALLARIWKIFDYPCGQRLKPLIRDELERLVSLGEIVCGKKEVEQLKSMGAATIDRRLRHEKLVLHLNKKTRERNPLLTHQIPIKTSSEFDRLKIGHAQVDFVEHCGSSSGGSYVNTLSFVDVASDWWEGEAVMGKGQEAAFSGFLKIRERLPFRLLGIHPDNQMSIINYQALAYCEKEGIEFTRSRPYQKNDNCFVEEKNWTHVRKLVGYLRYDTGEELAVLNNLYRNELRLYKNFFQPVIKLKDKTRINGQVKRRYDEAKTPYQRLMESFSVSSSAKKELTQIYESLNPAELKRKIDRGLRQLNLAYDYKKGRVKKSDFGVIFRRMENPVSVS